MNKTLKILALNIGITVCGISYIEASAQGIKKLEDSWYVGGAIGYSSLDPETPSGTAVSDDKSTSVKAYVGVDITEQIGIEGFWTGLGDSKVNGTAGNGKIKYSAIGINGIYHLPVNAGRVHPFGKLGIAKVKTKSTGVALNQKNDFSLFGGLGADYDVNERLKVRAEYEYFTEDVSQLSVGLNWSPSPRGDNLSTKRANQPIPAALPFNFASKPKQVTRTQKPLNPIRRMPTQVKTLNTSLSGASLFASGSSALSNQGIQKLSQLVNHVRSKDFKLYHITIGGHTDNRGSYKKNMALSKKRAESVANYMTSQGIQRSHMSVVGYGESQPIANNSSEYGRAKNRRVEIKIKGEQKVVAAK